MRDVVTDFYCDVLRKLLASGRLSACDSVLIVCGGPLDDAVMRKVGFDNFKLTNIDAVDEPEDAERLSYADGSFDIVIVHAGLHHCHSPHRALLEMYRVARKAAIAFESRDSLLMRLAVKLGFTLDYEVDSVTADGKGGVAESGIPNFVYRWTEREVWKLIATFDPAHKPRIEFFYDMRIPIQRLSRSGNHMMRAVGMIIEPLSRLFAVALPSQCNEFAFAILKNGELQPWMRRARFGWCLSLKSQRHHASCKGRERSGPGWRHRS
jgi:SAM-dependent methyltransferase